MSQKKSRNTRWTIRVYKQDLGQVMYFSMQVPTLLYRAVLMKARRLAVGQYGEGGYKFDLHLVRDGE